MIRIVGPRDRRVPNAVNTTSHSTSDWSRGLSPFALGPVRLYGGRTARLMENGWQFSKLYPEHADESGNPTPRYWDWARAGWNSSRAYRYPMGKGRRPLCSLWEGERLLYVEARKRIYVPLYRDAVRETAAYRRLKEMYRAEGSLTLWEFDGYDRHALGTSLRDVFLCETRICGHSFVLEAMLLYGDEFTVEDVLSGRGEGT